MPMDEGKKLRSHETWSLNGMPLTETRLDSAATTKKSDFKPFPLEKKEDALRALPRYFFFLCVWVLSKWRCSAAYHYRPLFNGCEKCAYMGILKPHSRLLRSFIFFLFLKLLQHAISHIFRPKVRSKQFFKKNLRVPNASKKGHSKHAIG